MEPANIRLAWSPGLISHGVGRDKQVGCCLCGLRLRFLLLQLTITLDLPYRTANRALLRKSVSSLWRKRNEENASAISFQALPLGSSTGDQQFAVSYSSSFVPHSYMKSNRKRSTHSTGGRSSFLVRREFIGHRSSFIVHCSSSAFIDSLRDTRGKAETDIQQHQQQQQQQQQQPLLRRVLQRLTY